MTPFEQQMQADIRLLNDELAARLADCDTAGHRVAEAMAYSLLSGGKRIRGVMTLAMYRLFAPDSRPALPFAAAVEMIHAYSLIHDDLPCMDDDDMRRGRPSCHIAFGESTALLAGDGLQALAFETAAASNELPADRVQQALAILARAAGVCGMVGGQGLDLAGENKPLTAEQLDAINLRKTGALFRACAGMGCALGGADNRQRAAADVYARHVGLAFQIADDVLDVTADPAKLGKPVGSDAGNQKNTYAALYGVAACRRQLTELAVQARQALEVFPNAQFLSELTDWLTGREN